MPKIKYQFIKSTADNSPTVIFESGRGDSHIVWQKVTKIVSTFANCFSYDRLNTGDSGETSKPITAKTVVSNLHCVLKKAHIKPPYILVGHSDGGLYVQMYARDYPEEISGVVLVDSASQNQTITAPIPDKENRQYQAAIGFPITQRQLLSAPNFPDIPLVVLTASYHGYKNPNKKFNILHNNRLVQMNGYQDQKLWDVWQKELANMSKKGVQLYVYNSSHYIQYDRPEAVADAIYTILKSTAH